MTAAKHLLQLVFVVLALAVFFADPPAGAAVNAMHVAALVIFAVGFWATGALPEHITGLILLLLAVLTAVAPAAVVFSGFTSATLWLVFGGLFMAEGVRATGLGERIVRLVLERHTGSYPAALSAVVAVAIGLAFVMPATIGRVLLLIPILTALAARMGFEPGSRGRSGLLLAGILSTYQCGTAVLPANAPNLVLAGAAENLYGVHFRYGDYLWVQFPVMGILKGLTIIGMTLLLFPAAPGPGAAPAAHQPMSAQERRMALILAVALAFWATDFLHGVQPGWVALAAGIFCVLPRIGVMPVAAFNDRIKYGPIFYIAAVLGMGGMMIESGLSKAIGSQLLAMIDLERGEHVRNFAIMTALSTFTGLFTTNPAQPALLAPIAGSVAEATGWPISAVLMTLAIGFTTVILPYQVPPVLIGLQVAGIRLDEALRMSVPLALFSLLVLVPLDYLWWRLIGYFG